MRHGGRMVLHVDMGLLHGVDPTSDSPRADGDKDEE